MLDVAAPEWISRANRECATRPDLFFPWTYGLECREQIEEAKALCRACPVRAACLEEALPDAQLVGIWGGLTPPERRRERVARRASLATAS